MGRVRAASAARTARCGPLAGGWRTLTNVLVDNILTADPRGAYRSDNHSWLFAAPGGRVFHAGPSRQMNWITTTGNGSITSAGLRSDSPDAMNGDAVMYDVGKILTVGGATAYENNPGYGAGVHHRHQ